MANGTSKQLAHLRVVILELHRARLLVSELAQRSLKARGTGLATDHKANLATAGGEQETRGDSARLGDLG